MSTNINHYVILGTKLDYNRQKELLGEGFYERFEKYMDTAYQPKKSGLVVLFDGMCGKYIIAGHVIASTACDEGGFDEPICANPADPDLVADIQRDLQMHLGLDKEPIQYWILSHAR